MRNWLKKEDDMGCLRDPTHEHRDSKPLALRLARQELLLALGKVAAIAVVLRVRMGEKTCP
jgi:hypothetical protein